MSLENISPADSRSIGSAKGLVASIITALLWTLELVWESMMCIFVLSTAALYCLISGSITWWICKHLLLWPFWILDLDLGSRIAATLAWLGLWIHFWTALDMIARWFKKRATERNLNLSETGQAEDSPGILSGYFERLKFQTSMVLMLNLPFLAMLPLAKIWFMFISWPTWAFDWTIAARTAMTIAWAAAICLIWAWQRPPNPKPTL